MPSKAFLGLFATLVDRSHDAPLCIYFCTPPSADVEDLRPIIDVLASHSERWSTVYLITPYSVVNAFQRIKGRLSALSRLYLSFAVEKHTMSTNDTVLDVFQEAPGRRRTRETEDDDEPEEAKAAGEDDAFEQEAIGRSCEAALEEKKAREGCCWWTINHHAHCQKKVLKINSCIICNCNKKISLFGFRSI